MKTRSSFCRLAIPVVALLAVGLGHEARAQVGPGGFYGGYGWGGWAGETVPGSAFRGMGAFAQGLGMGDRLSAEADAVRTQSFMALNEYLYRSNQMHRQQAAANRRASEERQSEARDALQDRRTSDPNTRDIESGDALNAILYQIDNPAIPDSLIRDASDDMTIPGSTVQKIPFRFSHHGAAISLRRLTSEGTGWPAVLRSEQLDPMREQYEDVVEQILEIPEGESVPPELVQQARDALGQMYQIVQNADLDGPAAAESLRHLKALAGMIAMLDQPEVKQVIDEAADVEEVKLGTLLNFMAYYNLQFGGAETPEEKAVYSQELYPKFAQLRDSLLEQFDGELPGSSQDDEQEFVGAPTDAFEGYDWEQLGINPRQ